MATKQKLKTTKRKKSNSGLFKGRNQLIIFVFAFAAVGAYLLWRSFAASPLLLTSQHWVKDQSVNTSTLTESSGSKKGGNVVQLVGGTTSKAVYSAISTQGIQTGIYNVCMIAKTTTATGGKIAVSAGSTIAGGYLSAPTSDYVETGCVMNVKFTTTTPTVTVTNTVSNAILKIGSIVLNRVGNLPTSNTNGGCSVNGTPAPCTVGSTTTGESGWGSTKFADEFNDSTIDRIAWTPTWLADETKNQGYSKPINTKETGCYHTGQASEYGGALHLVTASTNSDLCQTRSGSSKIRSGIVTSAGKKEYQYGYFEARINMPAAVNWPAWWTNGHHGSWPDRGELDIMENLECRHPAWRIHFPKSGGGDMNYGQCEDIPITGWHIYGMNWTPNRVDFYYDGNHVGGTNVSIPYNHFMVLNHGVRKDYPNGEVLNQDMQVDYARVWQK